MKVIGIAGYSGSGKTTLVERLIPELKRRGERVSVIKHAHHKFDIDHPGKDSWRHREAGAFEVLVASDRRLALMREFEQPTQLDVHQMLAELDPSIDWVLVEGFKHSDLPKLEVWRGGKAGDAERVPLHPSDPKVVAVATDRAPELAALRPADPKSPQPPFFDLDDAVGIADWLLRQAERFDYDKARPHG